MAGPYRATSRSPAHATYPREIRARSVPRSALYWVQLPVRCASAASSPIRAWACSAESSAPAGGPWVDVAGRDAASVRKGGATAAFVSPTAAGFASTCCAAGR
jgi:hypothetical protein